MINKYNLISMIILNTTKFLRRSNRKKAILMDEIVASKD